MLIGFSGGLYLRTEQKFQESLVTKFRDSEDDRDQYLGKVSNLVEAVSVSDLRRAVATGIYS